MKISKEKKQSIQKLLLRWYKRHQRKLPWRKDPDPYNVWISEIMLQQTQIPTALPYYDRWMKRFPTIHDLECAPLDSVLKCWEGLGYYARARNLHQAAQKIVKDFGGKIPSDYQECLKLPGVGRYTAGAILSIAYNKETPVLDGNVTRLLTRLFLIRQKVQERTTQEKLWKISESLIPQGEARSFNQALMELGSLVCTPQKPKCLLCPLRTVCKAFEKGIQEALPLQAEKKPLKQIQVAVAIIWRNGKLLIQKRPLEGLWGGLWEFAGGKKERGETIQSCLQRELKEELGIKVEVGKKRGRFKHQYTSFKVDLHVFDCQIESGRPKALWAIEYRWVKLDQLSSFAFPAANRKIIDNLIKKATDV